VESYAITQETSKIKAIVYDASEQLTGENQYSDWTDFLRAVGVAKKKRFVCILNFTKQKPEITINPIKDAEVYFPKLNIEGTYKVNFGTIEWIEYKHNLNDWKEITNIAGGEWAESITLQPGKNEIYVRAISNLDVISEEPKIEVNCTNVEELPIKWISPSEERYAVENCLFGGTVFSFKFQWQSKIKPDDLELIFKDSLGIEQIRFALSDSKYRDRIEKSPSDNYCFYLPCTLFISGSCDCIEETIDWKCNFKVKGTPSYKNDVDIRFSSFTDKDPECNCK
jgi:hypothetical protein